jgi:uncharacterized protein YqeY
MKVAMKAHDALRVNVLRMLIAACKYLKVEKYGAEDKALTDEEVLQVLTKQIKQRRDSFESYTSAGRPELADKEHQETGILQEYMPPQMSDDDVRAKVVEIKNTLGLSSPAQMGQLMGAAMKELKGKTDGTVVQRIAKEVLS